MKPYTISALEEYDDSELLKSRIISSKKASILQSKKSFIPTLSSVRLYTPHDVSKVRDEVVGINYKDSVTPMIRYKPDSRGKNISKIDIRDIKPKWKEMPIIKTRGYTLESNTEGISRP